MRGWVYIVMCVCPLEDIGGGLLVGAGETYHIDSVWTSRRKANRECARLNSEAEREWREDYGYGMFYVQKEELCK